MCRNIKQLFNFDPPVTDQEIDQAALQFVRKLSGFNKPSMVNQPAFDQAVQQIAADVKVMLNELKTEAKPRNREAEIIKAQQRSQKRFG